MAEKRKIAVLTSGGDAPGMNAAIRAVVRCAIGLEWEVFGVKNGYDGLLKNDIEPMTVRSVGGIIQSGGTILGSARCLEFKEEAGRKKGLANLEKLGINGLVVIGGNGSQTGAHALHAMGFPVVGIASTIDNDLYGSDITLGVDTALNVALTCIDMLKVTATSHRRAFIVEVMGRDCGYLALMTALAGGAEAVVIPEIETTPEQLVQEIQRAYGRGKQHVMIVVAEGSKYRAHELETYCRMRQPDLGFSVRATILGHLQRGGTPGAFDRNLGTRLGAGAIRELENGHHGVLVGLINSEVDTTPLDVVVRSKKDLDLGLFELARVLAQ